MLRLAEPQSIRAGIERRRRQEDARRRGGHDWDQIAADCRADLARFVDEHCRIEERGDPGILGVNVLGTDGAAESGAALGGAIRFRLWDAQRKALAVLARERRTVILKARQLGLTWLVLAYALWLCLFRPSRLVVWYSDTLDNATDAIERAKFMYRHLPDGLRAVLPQPVGDARGEFRFDNGSILRARAATESAGVSFTASLIVLDEMARMKRAKQLLAAAQPTMEAGGQLICLSTARGTGNTFHRVWQQAHAAASDFFAIFLPWWARPGRDQAWYDAQVRNAEDPALVPENYPSTPEDAFVASDDTRYPAEWIAYQRQHFARDPLPWDQWPERLRRLDLDAYGLNRGRSAQRLDLYAPPAAGRRVVVGADTAEGLPGGDYDAAVALDADTGEELARLRGRWEPDEYADLLCELAVVYGATLVVERNNHGHAVLTAIKHREQRHARAETRRERELFAVPRIGRGLDQRRGWLTNQATKPPMIALVARGLRDAFARSGDAPLFLRSPDLLAELADYRRLGGTKFGAPEGGHDDLVMALAVALGYVHLRPRPGTVSAG